jgi:uncharacterized membrane protein YdbT with pleckstrin-like domain
VAFPQESLAQGEEVKLHLHPHGIVLFFPIFWLVVAAAAVAVSFFVLSWSGIPLIIAGAAALIFVLWRTFIPWISWKSTHYVITTRQVLFRTGVLSREERGISLNKINDVKSTQSLFERILGAGTLTVESAGEHGQTILRYIPNVIHVKNTLQHLVEEDHDSKSLDENELREALREHREAGGSV